MILHQVTNSRGNYNYNAFIYNNIYWVPHFHGNFELIYVYEGNVNISLNGVAEVLHKGELILIPPYTVHSLDVKCGKTWVGVFSEDYIYSYCKKYKYVKYSKFKCGDDVEKILQNHLFYEGVPDRFMRISCLYMVCNECIKNATLCDSEQNNTFVHRVVTYVCDNLSGDVELKDIADFMNYEYHYFSSLFNQYFGISFKGFVNQLRVEKACALLSENENSITYIAQFCGFGSIRNFNRVFKNLCGCTPREYISIQLSLT